MDMGVCCSFVKRRVKWPETRVERMAAGQKEQARSPGHPEWSSGRRPGGQAQRADSSCCW
eukprot:5302308-Pyramimonas_sp.AAC.1